VVAEQAQQAEQIVESLKTKIDLLEARRTETEETVRRKEVENQRWDESLNSKIAIYNSQ
jgi:hypothetical protein